jgi:hypothetical protein
MLEAVKSYSGTAINLSKSSGILAEFRFEDIRTCNRDKTVEMREKFRFCF